jgi:hypothetical protein
VVLVKIIPPSPPATAEAVVVVAAATALLRLEVKVAFPVVAAVTVV